MAMQSGGRQMRVPSVLVRVLSVLIVGAAMAAHAAPASAGAILLASNGAGYQVNFYEPIGQSFTAEDAFVHAALSFEVINSGFANDDEVEYSLYEGEGVGGALVASSSFNLADGFSGFHLVDFSSVVLTVGNQYTLVASILGDSPYWAINTTSDAYVGGNGVLSGALTGETFALNVVPVAVPEPISLVLIGLGGVSVLARRRFARAHK
jgi:hypothetical protein